MAEIYLALFILGCISCLGWGLDKMSRIYQFPFFMGGMFVAFLMPQAIALYLSADTKLPNQRALERVLLMSALCVFMCLFSTILPVSPKAAKSWDINLNLKRLFYGGVFLATLGMIFTVLTMRTEYATNAIGQATGLRTIFSTLTYLSMPGFAMVLTVALKRPNALCYAAAAAAAFVPLYRIIVFGRRETTGAFFLTVGLVLFFQKKIKPPRTLAIAAIVFALLAIPIIGQYRAISTSGRWDLLGQLDPLTTFQNMVQESNDSELRWAALSMDATLNTKQYGFGLGYWNELVFRFVPAQWVGREFKEGLMLPMQDFSLRELYGYVVNPGFVMPGVGDTFMEFDYLGCVVFLGVGYLYKILWTSATRFGSLSSQLLYISSIPGLLKIVSHGTKSTLADITFNFIFIFCVFLYARQPLKTPSIWLRTKPSLN